MDPITQIISDAYENVKDFAMTFRRDFQDQSNDNPITIKHKKHGNALISRQDREEMLQALAEGAKDDEMAELYNITEQQVKKMRNNYRHDFKRYKAAFEKEMADMEEQEQSDPVMTALRALNGKAIMHPNGKVFLNGKPSCVKEMIATANMVLKEKGKKPIYYPGVLDLEERCAPSFKV